MSVTFDTWLERWLTHRCTLTGIVTSAVDSDLQIVPTAGNAVSGIHCRLRDLSVQEQIDATDAGTLVVESVLILPVTAAVTERARVTTVTDATTSAVLDAGPFEVLRVLRRRSSNASYQQALLRRYR